ncbi:VOC family protein [Streptomyces sp. NPDC038707]|uniref:VOC family protein n=1 Tax=unclassified Streptomyces TaxID=2593676 RepID=UPI0033EE4A6E
MPRSQVEAGRRTGIPALRRVDHFAFTVADLHAAIEFFADVLGGQLCYIEGPVQDPDGDWMTRKLGVHASATAQVAMVRLGPATNLELFQYTAPGQRTAPPRLGDPGGRRLSLRVDALDAVAALLRTRPDVRVDADEPVPGRAGDAPGRRVALTTSWGMLLELRGTTGDPATGHAPPAGPAEVRGADHLALTVTDLAASVRFFTDVIGAAPLPADGPREDGDTARTRLRLGPTDRVELRAHTGNGTPPAPRNSDVGGSHIAFHTDDVDAAAAYLAAQPGVHVMGTPETITGGPIEGNRWVYFTTPIGVQMEVLCMPDGRLPYERRTRARRVSSHSFSWA